jgi:hypothetical protein
MTQAQDNFDIDAMLDGTLDDLADLPEFKPYPAGTHAVILTIVDKTAAKNRVNNHPGFEVKMKAVETLELANSEDTPLVAGAETSVLYLLDNPIGQGSFKKLLASAAEHFGAKSNRELIADLQGATVAVVTRTRQNKDKTQTYTDIVEMKVA